MNLYNFECYWNYFCVTSCQCTKLKYCYWGTSFLYSSGKIYLFYHYYDDNSPSMLCENYVLLVILIIINISMEAPVVPFREHHIRLHILYLWIIGNIFNHLVQYEGYDFHLSSGNAMHRTIQDQNTYSV